MMTWLLYVARKDITAYHQEHDSDVKAARVLVMGATFKENVSDIRNSKVADVVKELTIIFFEC